MNAIKFSIQPANTESGEYDVKLPLPHPFHTDGDGEVIDHIVMDKAHVIGFCKTSDPGTIDLTWPGFLVDPQSAVGMFMVTVDMGGQFATWTTPISRVAEYEKTEAPG